MSSKPILPQIDFAKRHLTTEVSTFNAISAIVRLEALVEDASDAASHLQPILKERWHPAFYEFVSYYQVGFVTCLEWHAKSRLYDLFAFDPKRIHLNDIKQGLSDAKLAQMISEGLTIPHLLASASSISTYAGYIQAISRVLEAMDAADALSDLLDVKDKEGKSTGSTIQELYENRNKLVHEIDLGDIGHRNIRNYMEFEEIIRQGTVVIELIKGIEIAISKSAPYHFPNLLDVDGYPIDQVERMQKLIEATESKIRASIVDGKSIDYIDIQSWDDLVRQSWQYLNAEMEFIDNMGRVGANYYDVRPSLKAQLLKNRLLHLENIGKHFLFEVDDTATET
ncbi:hypothetical protein BA190_10320 [Labrys sp. WJW]|uniref:hypothetical protein n=1 Tax=Labrys sp. WJW TaxID=1737983 RepID=UPI00083508C6|nr:hypothetical protein [Labrys sp. WJW]OCC05289.1 hypothetical protein BA190_10320 [Labrys sp. WJW]